MKENSQGYLCQDINDKPDLIKFVDEYGKTANCHVDLKIEETKQSLNEAFKIIASIRQKVEELNLDTSFLFNFFDIFRVNENTMSKILAFLLNPKGKHGQRDLYFIEFCKYFDLQIPPYESFYIRCEESTDINRRIDLLIKAGDFFIIIENKFRGAEDQEHQLKHYYEFIRLKAKSENHVYLFYMNQDGNEPSEYTFPRKSEEESRVWEKPKTSKKLITVPFKQDSEHKPSIFKYLKICKVKTVSKKMHFFIDDIMHHISRENKMNKYKEQMFHWLSETPERTENAYDIFMLWDEYKKHVVKNFLLIFEPTLNQALSNNFKEHQFVAVKKGDIFKKPYSGFTIKILNDYFVYIQSDAIGFDSIHYGLAPFHNDDNLASNSKNKIEWELNAEIMKEFNGSGKATDFSIIKYESDVSNFNNISNFTKLLPNKSPDNCNEIMSIWINELTSFIDFILIKSKIFNKLCQPQIELEEQLPVEK